MTSASAAGSSCGEVLRATVGEAGRALVQAHEAVVEPGLIQGSDLVASLESLVGLRALAEPVMVAIVGEAIERGLPDAVGLSVRDWLGVRCPWLARSEIGDLVTVAEGIKDPRHEDIAVVARAGGVPLRRLAQLLRALGRIAPACHPEAYSGSVEVLLPVVADPDFADKDLKAATDHLLECALPDKDKAAAAAAAYDCREIHESSLAGGLLTRFVMTCDAQGAALIRAILVSPLSAPSPGGVNSRVDETCGAGAAGAHRVMTSPAREDETTQSAVDGRSAKQRRYDAVIAVLERGMASPHGTPTTSRAKIFVTMSYDMLSRELAGAGHTLTGDSLSASAVRRLACTADLIPVVLGSESEPLDLGREHRLATPGQTKALWLRDKHCTFPGCTIPATWTDAHHVSWWSRNGRTDLTNLALLCGRHHTRVHDLDLTATITTTGVTWHV